MSSRSHIRPVPDRQDRPSRDNGSNGGGGLDERLRPIENRLTQIETEFKHVPTKHFLEQKLNEQLKWILGTLVAVIVAIAIVARVIP